MSSGQQWDASAQAQGACSLWGTGLTVTRQGKQILSEASIGVDPGEMVALIGPNGAGKSTALGVLAGDISPDAGCVRVGESPLEQLSHRQRARLRAVLPQHSSISFDYEVHDVVAMGRTPWPSGDEDDALIARALEVVDAAHLAGRSVSTLSGGEMARVSLARVLTQTTGIILLDEPTAALDIAHQESVMALARGLADAGCAVLTVVHDLSLAAAWCDRLTLMREGSVVLSATPWDVCTPELLGEVYGWPVSVEADRRTGAPIITPIRSRSCQQGA